MSSVVLEDAQRACGAKEGNQNGKTISIKVRTSRTSNSVFTSEESLMANSSQSNGNSRVSSRRFTWTHVVRVGDLQTSNFSGMDSSSVISTGSLSCPRVDLLATYLDIHRISSVDVVYTIPTQRDLSHRIGKCDPLVEVSHLGANKAQMKEECDQKSPARSGQDALEIFGKETLTNDSKTDEVDGAREEVSTSRTVHLNITHERSLSRKVMR